MSTYAVNHNIQFSRNNTHSYELKHREPCSYPSSTPLPPHNSKCDCKMLNVAVIIRKLMATFEICNHVTATFEIVSNVNSMSNA